MGGGGTPQPVVYGAPPIRVSPFAYLYERPRVPASEKGAGSLPGGGVRVGVPEKELARAAVIDFDRLLYGTPKPPVGMAPPPPPPPPPPPVLDPFERIRQVQNRNHEEYIHAGIER